MSGNEIFTAVTNQSVEQDLQYLDVSTTKLEGDFFIQDNVELDELLNEQYEQGELEGSPTDDDQHGAVVDNIENRNKTAFSMDVEDNLKASSHPRSIQFNSIQLESIIKKNSTDTYIDFDKEEPNVWVEYPEQKVEEIPVEEPVKEDSPSMISRFTYYEKHAELLKQKTSLSIENTLLQRKVATYLKKIKMEFDLKGDIFDNNKKYSNRLDEYAKILKESNLKKNLSEKQIQLSTSLKEEKGKLINETFRSFQDRLKNIGQGLIYSKTGSEIAEKLIQHLINRQATLMKVLSEMRLKYIKLKTMVEEKEALIQSLDEVDKDHHLTYYEKLKSDHKIYSDKIEEREVELEKVRSRFTETIGIIAHCKEKIAANESDIYFMKDISEQSNIKVMIKRSDLSERKKKRDLYRGLLINSRNSSGLLTHSELLKDMQHSMVEFKKLKQLLDNLKTDCNLKIHQIRRIRRLIEIRRESPQQTRKNVSTKSRKITLSPFPINNSPCIFTPVFSSEAFDYLEQDFQPTVSKIILHK